MKVHLFLPPCSGDLIREHSRNTMQNPMGGPSAAITFGSPRLPHDRSHFSADTRQERLPTRMDLLHEEKAAWQNRQETVMFRCDLSSSRPVTHGFARNKYCRVLANFQNILRGGRKQQATPSFSAEGGLHPSSSDFALQRSRGNRSGVNEQQVWRMVLGKRTRRGPVQQPVTLFLCLRMEVEVPALNDGHRPLPAHNNHVKAYFRLQRNSLQSQYRTESRREVSHWKAWQT